MLNLQQWLAEALLPSLGAFYFAWKFLGRKDGEAVPIRWWWYVGGIVATLLMAVALRYGHLIYFGGSAVLNPTNGWILYFYVLLPGTAAFFTAETLRELPASVLNPPVRRPGPPSEHLSMQMENKPDLHWKNWSGWLLLLYGVAIVYVNVRPTQQAELFALVMVLVLVGVPLLVLYAWKGFRPRSRVRPLLGAFTTASVLLGLAVLGELPQYRAPISQAQPALTSSGRANATSTPVPQTYSAVPPQETSEEYMDRMFAGAVDRFFADEQNGWILRDEVMLRFERHIAAVFASQPTLNYDDLLVKARTALEDELGDVTPAAPIVRPQPPPSFVDPYPKRGCSYRGVMTDAEIAECRRQGLR